MSNVGRVVVLGLVIFATVGCSAVKTYPNSLEKNMHVATQIDSGSATLSTVAEFDIHRVDSNCELIYQGRVFLDDAKTEVGIPVDGLIYLDFIFASKRFLSSNISGVRHGMLLSPRPGYVYKTQVKYIKGVYSVAIHEVGKGATAGRLIERMPLSACKPRK